MFLVNANNGILQLFVCEPAADRVDESREKAITAAQVYSQCVEHVVDYEVVLPEIQRS